MKFGGGDGDAKRKPASSLVSAMFIRYFKPQTQLLLFCMGGPVL